MFGNVKFIRNKKKKKKKCKKKKMVKRMKRSYIFRTEPSVLFTEKVYSLAKADEFIQSGPSGLQNTMVHFFKLFIHT